MLEVESGSKFQLSHFHIVRPSSESTKELGSASERIRIKLKNLIKIFKIRERMSLSIPLVMRIVILFDWRMEFFFVSHLAQEFSS
jgi:hypothetical protein